MQKWAKRNKIYAYIVHDSGSMQDAATGGCEIFNDYNKIGDTPKKRQE